MWNFGGGGGGGGGNPWLQGLVRGMGNARGGMGMGGGGGGGHPMFGLGGLFSRMGQGWGGGAAVGGGGDRSMGQPGSPNSMSFAPNQSWGMNAGMSGGQAQNFASGDQGQNGPLKLNPEMANSGQDNNWSYGKFANPNPNTGTPAPRTFTPTSGSQRMGGQKLSDSDEDD